MHCADEGTAGPIHLTFAGLNAPVRIAGCPELLAPIARIVPGWPFHAGPPVGEGEPVATIRQAAPGRYLVTTPSRPGEERRYDTVDAVCELVAELSGELHRSGDWLMCLHAAAIDLAGRLVILPNVRRAGKSTLTACLAARGHRVFSDDFFPLSLSREGHLQGHATGVLPRLRLPVPAAFGAAFRGWVATNPGDGNRRYKYLELPETPRHGTALPLGAMVFLDRRDGAAPALAPMPAAEAVAALLHQNFAREVHSGTILATAHALFAGIGAWRLSYGSAEEAADLLETKFGRWDEEPVAVRDAPAFRRVDDRTFAAPAPAFDAALPYVRAAGTREVEIDGDRYLADASGLGVHRLNAGALAIWHLIAEPMRLDELCDILAEAFPEELPERIAADSRETLRRLAENGLAVPAG